MHIMDGSNEYHKQRVQNEIMKSLKVIDHKIEAYVQHTIDELEKVNSIGRADLDSSYHNNDKQQILTNIN